VDPKTVPAAPAGRHRKPDPDPDPERTQRIPGLAAALDINDLYADQQPDSGRHHRKGGA
jgi:hypothetical protein